MKRDATAQELRDEPIPALADMAAGELSVTPETQRLAAAELRARLDRMNVALATDDRLELCRNLPAGAISETTRLLAKAELEKRSAALLGETTGKTEA